MAITLALAVPAAAEDADAAAPLLTVDEAIAAAQHDNHVVAVAAREVDKAGEQEAALATRRLPGFRVDAVGSRLLESIDFTFPAGSFGTFPGIGPVPATETKVSAPSNFTATVAATVTQPITQQVKIGLGVDAANLGRQVAQQDLRRERQRVAADVRSTYYALSAIEAGVVALRDLVRALEEMDALTTRYLDEGLALRPDALEVKARLARERQKLAAAESGLASQREHLNQLLGRPLGTPFRVSPPSELTSPAGGLDLDAARARARAQRPEFQAAALRTSQAETALRLSRADWIPDLSLMATYMRNINYQVIPEQVVNVGLVLSWEPFDWGRRGHEAGVRSETIAQAKQVRDQTDEQIALDVGVRWRALRDASALLDATRLSEQAAQASLELTRNRYREDARMLKDVLQAEAQLSSARHDFTDALAGYWSAAAELERAIGHEG